MKKLLAAGLLALTMSPLTAMADITVRCQRSPTPETLLRCCPQHRERRIADNHSHCTHRDILKDGRSDLRRVQGHGQHGASA